MTLTIALAVLSLVLFWGAVIAGVIGLCRDARRGDEPYARAVNNEKTRTSR